MSYIARNLTQAEIDEIEQIAYELRVVLYEPYNIVEKMHHNCAENTCKACIGE